MVFQPSTNKHIFTYCDQQCQYGVTICSVSTVVLTFDLWYGKLISAFHEYCAFILFSLSNILLALSQPVSFLCVCVCVWVMEQVRAGHAMAVWGQDNWPVCVCVCVCDTLQLLRQMLRLLLNLLETQKKNARPNTHTRTDLWLSLKCTHTNALAKAFANKQKTFLTAHISFQADISQTSAEFGYHGSLSCRQTCMSYFLTLNRKGDSVYTAVFHIMKAYRTHLI